MVAAESSQPTEDSAAGGLWGTLWGKLTDFVLGDEVQVVAVKPDGPTGGHVSPTPTDPDEDSRSGSPELGVRTQLYDYMPASPFHPVGAVNDAQRPQGLTVTDMVNDDEALTFLRVMAVSLAETDRDRPASGYLASAREAHREQVLLLDEKNRKLQETMEQASARERAAQHELSKLTPHMEMMERQLRIVNNWVDDWVAPVKPVQSQHAWLHAMEQEAMLDDVNDDWADLADERGGDAARAPSR